MAHDVFISHSAKDKLTADALCASLEARGIRCWMAPRDILPSVEWGEAIVHALKASRVMVLIFSANANQSPQIKREVERAVNKEIPIIPFRIENVLPSESLEYYLSTPHWLDALTPPMEKHFQNLAETVELLLSRSGTGTPSDRSNRWEQKQQHAPQQPAPQQHAPQHPPHQQQPQHFPQPPVQSKSEGAGRNATVALVLGIVSLFCCGLVTGLVAVIMGFQELKAIDAGRSSPAGRSNAKAGIVLGFIGIGVWLILSFVYFLSYMQSMNARTLR